jgi:hypothetical protein
MIDDQLHEKLGRRTACPGDIQTRPSQQNPLHPLQPIHAGNPEIM